jgi:hypothetical protein
MEAFFTALAANGLVLAALAYLLKVLIGAQLQKSTIEFQKNLEHRVSEELEQYRHDLEKERVRLQISYGGIFERQANAIISVYEAIIELETGIFKAVHEGGDVPERREAFRRPWAELRQIHQKNRILLPPEIDTAMDSFLDRVFRGVFGYLQVESRDLSRLSDKQIDQLFERQDRAIEVVEKEVPALREQLITSMRGVIGVVADSL